MNKYRSIETLLQRLAGLLTTGQLAVAEGWRDDEQVVGFIKPDEPRLTAFVFTHGQLSGRYGIHLEYPDASMAGFMTTTAEDVSLERLYSLLETHFEFREIDH